MYRVRQGNQALKASGRVGWPMPEYKHIYPSVIIKDTNPSDHKIQIPAPPKGEGGGSKKYSLTYQREDKKPSETAPDFEKFQWLKRNDPRYRGYRFEDYEFQQRVLRATDERRKQQEHRDKRMAEVNKAGRKRVVTVNGMPLERPSQVPSFAHAKLVYDAQAMTYSIYWAWKYEDTKQFSYVQRISAETYEIQNYNGEVMKSWVVITDPVTGEHLGSYNTKTKELSNEVEGECLDCLACDCDSCNEPPMSPVDEDAHATEEFLKQMQNIKMKITEMQEKVG
jgi:hypothetical protein